MKKFSERIIKRFEYQIKEVMEKFKDENAVGAFGSANFFGQESLGLRQVRGNGVLVLTEKELYFEMWHPKKILHIPTKSIQKISTPTSYLTKTRFKKLLKVSFKNERNQNDSATWLIKNVLEWKNAIKLIHKHSEKI